MTTLVIALVLSAAAMHAAWNGLVKISGDRLAVMAALMGVGGVIGLGMIPFFAVPAPEAWPFLGLSLAIHMAYYVGLIRAYRHGDLSQVYPIARGAAPIMVALASGPAMGETLSTTQMVGVGLVSAGILSLAIGQGSRRAAAWAFLTAVTIALYSLADATGVRKSGDALGYIAWLFFIDGIPLLVVAFARRGRDLAGILRRDLGRTLLGGALSIAGYGIVIWAYSLGTVATIAALRETSVVFAAIIGSVFLGEPFGARRIAAAIVVALGILVMTL